MALDIRDRLLRAEGDFLQSILHDEDNLSSYSAFWTSLGSDFSLAVAQKDLDAEVVGLGRNVASRIDSIAHCFLDINEKLQELYNRGLLDILQGISGVQILEATPSQEPRGTPSQTMNSSPPKDEDRDFYPPFLAPAYDWLLKNLHNPYPSTDFKRALALTSGCPISAISSWFANVRRRMGWTAICRDHFSNARGDAVDAASKILANDDLHHTFPPELVHAFVTMKVNAEELYSSLFTRSALAGDLDSVLKNMSAVDRKHANDGTCHLVDEESSSAQGPVEVSCRGHGASSPKKHAAETWYPSPNRSHSSSPIPTLDSSLTDTSEDEDEVSPPILAGRKRRSSFLEPDISTGSRSTTRQIKRLRPSFTSSASSTCLPSPPTSTDHDSPKHTLPCIPQSHTNATPSRKRRRSNADIDSIPKRPGCFTALHTVSDPLPRPGMETEYSIDDWFNINFDSLFVLPPPVEAVEPDLSTQWEIGLFNNYSIPQDLQKRQSKCLPPSIQDDPASSPVDFAELENLLHSMGSGECQQSTIPPDSTFTPKDFPLSSELSQSIDWTAMLNSEEFLAPTINSIYPHPSAVSQSLSGIDLSILQLPDITHPVSLRATANELGSKQAKLLQLQAMQEAVRRMERELHSEGITI